MVYVPVPWEATVSYGGGSGYGPSAILKASRQVDLYDIDVLKPYESGLHMLPEPENVVVWCRDARANAEKIIDVGGDLRGDKSLGDALAHVNELSGRLNRHVHSETARLLEKDKLVGVIGGEHSVPFGAIQAVAERCDPFGILHIDAHSDTRNAYEGFAWSHASLMRNVLEQIPKVKKVVQVGVRDFCEEEFEYCLAQDERVRVWWDRDLASRRFDGEGWSSIAKAIVEDLPQTVWISFDIDGLDPRFCPHTGTPVPGGIDFDEANHLLSLLARSGRRILGFDLCEVAPGPSGEWDANVGARLLYKLSAWALASQGKASLRR
ncbi:arginase family protein [Elusimicrobiota bacterium]